MKIIIKGVILQVLNRVLGNFNGELILQAIEVSGLKIKLMVLENILGMMEEFILVTGI